MRDLLGKLFAPPVAPVGPRDAIAWWERRRLVVNGIVLGAAIVSLGISLALISAASSIMPGLGDVTPTGLVNDAIVFPIALNVLYTFGWLIEAVVRLAARKRLLRLGPVLLGVGITASLLLLLSPALKFAVMLIGARTSI